MDPSAAGQLEYGGGPPLRPSPRVLGQGSTSWDLTCHSRSNISSLSFMASQSKKSSTPFPSPHLSSLISIHGPACNLPFSSFLGFLHENVCPITDLWLLLYWQCIASSSCPKMIWGGYRLTLELVKNKVPLHRKMGKKAFPSLLLKNFNNREASLFHWHLSSPDKHYADPGTGQNWMSRGAGGQASQAIRLWVSVQL